MAKEKFSKDVEDSIGQLQLLQQRTAVFTNQKQQLQLQQMEVDSALGEIKGAKSPVYRLVGGLLVEKSASEVKKDLDKVKKDLDLRIKSLEIQEEKTHNKMTELQTALSKELNIK